MSEERTGCSAMNERRGWGLASFSVLSAMTSRNFVVGSRPDLVGMGKHSYNNKIPTAMSGKKNAEGEGSHKTLRRSTEQTNRLCLLQETNAERPGEKLTRLVAGPNLAQDLGATWPCAPASAPRYLGGAHAAAVVSCSSDDSILVSLSSSLDMLS